MTTMLAWKNICVAETDQVVAGKKDFLATLAEEPRKLLELSHEMAAP